MTKDWLEFQLATSMPRAGRFYTINLGNGTAMCSLQLTRMTFAANTNQRSNHEHPYGRRSETASLLRAAGSAIKDMTAAVVLFPGSNRDRDMIAALNKIGGKPPLRIWHTDRDIPDADLYVVPGGFSYGDYLRSGAIAARSPVMDALREKAAQGRRILGVCNGFQILTEAGLLPGALMRNAGLHFVCKEVLLEVTNASTVFTSRYDKGQILRCPVAHHDGNYFADAETLKALEGNGQVAFRYAKGTNPNGSINDIAGIVNDAGNVLGMMPHPENLIEPAHGGTDGRALFEAAMGVLEGEPA